MSECPRAIIYSLLSLQVVILATAIVSFVWGFLNQSFYQSVIIFGVGSVVSAVLTLPPWPMYQKHPVKWLEPEKTEIESGHGDEDKKVQ
jgi:signal peptidase complex subunit 1